LLLEVPGMDVRFSDNFFDLPAGRTIVIGIETSGLAARDIMGRLRITSLRDSY